MLQIYYAVRSWENTFSWRVLEGLTMGKFPHESLLLYDEFLLATFYQTTTLHYTSLSLKHASIWKLFLKENKCVAR
jgi:hypothetical protein